MVSDFLSSVLHKRTSSCRRAEIYPLYRHHTLFLRIKCFLRFRLFRGRWNWLSVRYDREQRTLRSRNKLLPFASCFLTFARKRFGTGEAKKPGKEHYGRWSWNVLARSLTFLSTPLSLYSLKSSFVPWKMVFCSLTALPVIEKRFLLRYAPLTFRRKVDKKKKKQN